MLSIKHLPLVLVLFTTALSAEQSGDTGTFEIASVKVNGSGDPGGSMRTTPGGRFKATNTTMRTLLRYAYNVRDFQIAAAPVWFDSLRYDIVAKAPGSASIAEFRAMVQKLLTDRFDLVLRREMKAAPAYALKAGKRGPNMKSNAEGDTSVVSGQTEIRRRRSR